MNKITSLIIVGAIFLFFSCGKNEGPASVSGTPVETKQSNTNYKPAFEGQTRVAGVKSATPYEGTVLDSSLVRPWGITSLPDGRFLITEKEGRIRIAEATGQMSAPINGIPAVNSEGQGGLLGI